MTDQDWIGKDVAVVVRTENGDETVQAKVLGISATGVHAGAVSGGPSMVAFMPWTSVVVMFELPKDAKPFREGWAKFGNPN